MNKDELHSYPSEPQGNSNRWALILGGSSGLGLATAKKLGTSGYNLIIVHRDRKTSLPEIKAHFEQIRSGGTQLISYNADAVLQDKRRELIETIHQSIPQTDKISVLVHSIAKGHLKPMRSDKDELLEGTDLQLTINAMAISLYDWTRDLYDAQMLADDTRIIAFTSEGNTKALPYYGAVSAAKAALDAIVRNIAMEFAASGIKANCLQAGVTDTPSFRRIPHRDRLREAALSRNPHGRLTTPEDVANVVDLLCRDEATWITGTVIKVDGGESLI